MGEEKAHAPVSILFLFCFFSFLKIILFILSFLRHEKFQVLLMSLLRALRRQAWEKYKMGFKVRCETFSRDLCNTIDKTDKKGVYLLFSRKSNRRRRRKFKRTIINNTLMYISRIQEVVFHLQWVAKV